MFDAKEIISANTDWIALVFLTILALLVVLKFFFSDRLYHTNLLFFSKNNLSSYFNRDKAIVFNLFQILFFIIQLLTISLFLFLIIRRFRPDFELFNMDLFLIILIGVLLYFGLRYILGTILAFVLNLNFIHRKLLNEKINYFNNLILWCLPFLVFLAYAKEYQSIFLKISIFVCISLLILRYVLVLSNNKKLIFSDLLYFILYLCALEIAPLVIILKLTI